MELSKNAPDTSPEPDDGSWEDENRADENRADEHLADESRDAENEDDESPSSDAEFVGEEPPPRPRRRYWQAHGLAELALSEFREALAQGDGAAQRRAFYRLGVYYGRTVRILRGAVQARNQALAQAAMHNLLTLHQPLVQMHQAAPQQVPLPLLIERNGRDHFVKDLLVRALSDSPEPASVPSLVDQVAELGLLGRVGRRAVQRHLNDLSASGHVTSDAGRYRRTDRVYAELDLDEVIVRTLFGDKVHRRLVQAGFRGANNIRARLDDFYGQFPDLVGLDQGSAHSMVEIVGALQESGRDSGVTTPWRHRDLVGSPIPRPYQHESFAVFRGHGYQGQLVESPTGSGKTMIGMMCIQDWLRSMSPGQSILVMVPTSNYQQQWVGELCYKPIGLRLAPEVVFSGTPTQLDRFRERTGTQPAIIVLTYTALAQMGSAVGKGGFDVDSVEMFLQGANVRYVILDEVHKVVDDMDSVSADVARLLIEWLRDGSIRGLVGFSGTAGAYVPRFVELGLDLAHSIPVSELIADGFVAPFAEYGVPFSYSAREWRIHELLDAYKAQVRKYLRLLGSEWLRARFTEVPMVERVSIARDLLGMYQGRARVEEALARRMKGWEKGEKLPLNGARLVTVLQIAHGWSDEALVRMCGANWERFETIRAAMEDIRRELAGLIYLPRTVERLTAPGFTTTVDVESLSQLPSRLRARAARIEAAKGLLCTTVVGLYQELGGWYRRVGEGRVNVIKAVIGAERRSRPVRGVIVFDRAKRIDWRPRRGTRTPEVARPGYSGLGGLFAHMMGDERFVPMAALSSELYLPASEEDPLPPRLARFVEDELLRGDLARAMLSLITQGLDLSEEMQREFDERFHNRVDRYVSRMKNVRRSRPGRFSRSVLGPLRRYVRQAQLGRTGERLIARMRLDNVHLGGLILSFFDYAMVAEGFRRARLAELEQVSGDRQPFYIVPMPPGRRKPLMYDLISRIVDAEDLPIDLVIVSSWARTGWNVLSPNVLIDATATRSVTAWQQLRGRAMRPFPTWTNECYRLTRILVDALSPEPEDEIDLPVDAVDQDDIDLVGGELLLADDLSQENVDVPVAESAPGMAMEESLRQLLGLIASPDLWTKVEERGIEALTVDEAQSLAVDLMLDRNKVTHIYEMVKAYGSTSQVEYHRRTGVWRRREAIRVKHLYNAAVHPLTGELLRGAEHAPLLYADDPRTDVPSALEQRVEETIRGRDGDIVAGWLKQRG